MARPFSHILSVPHRRHEGKCKTLYRGYTMKEQTKQRIHFPFLSTWLLITVFAFASGTEVMAQPGNGENPGAGVAGILDEDTVPEEDDTAVVEQAVLENGFAGEAALSVSVGSSRQRRPGKSRKKIQDWL